MSDAAMLPPAVTRFRRPPMARYARERHTISIPGDRAGLFVPPAVEELARQFQICLDLVERKHQP
jgi:hypothetical protein